MEISPGKAAFVTNRRNVDASIWSDKAHDLRLVQARIELRRRDETGKHQDDTAFVDLEGVPDCFKVHPPGFGVSIADAVQASCSAFPFFHRKVVTTSAGDRIELIDGGYCANNPTLYAIADAVAALKVERANLRVVSVGVGVYPQPRRIVPRLVKMIPFNSIDLLQKTLEINTQSMDQLRTILFHDVPTIRISDTFERPEMATDLLEHDLSKLNILRQRGRESFASREKQLEHFLK
ncbi:MAG: patatin-like phospholipase family protein [Myxococcales bacterium]